MKKFTSNLRERVILLENNTSRNSTTFQKYIDVLHTRAAIKFLKSDNLENLYEIIIPKPPKGKILHIAGITWRNKEYFCKTTFSEYKDKFLKGTMSCLLTDLPKPQLT